MMKKLIIGLAAAVASASFAQDVERPPVYRGQYYAFDVYPHGYQGYPGFPYYGAPFGSGGPAFAAASEQVTVDRSKEVATTHVHRITRKRAR